MSAFICSMFSAGLSEMPPVSKVIVFPTRTTGRSSFFLEPLYWRMMNFGGSWLPFATPSKAPMPRLLHVLLLENLERSRPFLSRWPCFMGDLRRRHHIGRMVAEVANEDRGFRRRDAPPDPFTNWRN